MSRPGGRTASAPRSSVRRRLRLRSAISRASSGAIAAAFALAAAGPARGISIVQHPLGGPYSPVVGIAAWPGGLEIARQEGQTHVVLQRVQASPAFALSPAVRTEALTLGAGPDGDLWLVDGGAADASGSVSLSLLDLLPSGAAQSRYTFPEPLGGSCWPAAIAPGPDGSEWVADMTGERIDRILPGGGEVSYPLPRAGAPTSIAVAPDGSAWFTEPVTGAIGEVTPDGRVIEHPIEEGGGFGSAEPFSIVVGPDGALWFTELNVGRIGRMTESGGLQEFPIPDPGRVPQGLFGAPAPRAIAVGPDGALWFTDDGEEAIGRITLAGQVTEYAIPESVPASPQGIASYDGELWFAEAGLDALGSMEPAAEQPSGARSGSGASAGTRRRRPRRRCGRAPRSAGRAAGARVRGAHASCGTAGTAGRGPARRRR